MTHEKSDFAVSRDGTRIQYHQTGSGPEVVFVHGSLSTTKNYSQLIAEMAKHCTIYTFDRRGFGENAYESEHSPQQDIEDTVAVLEKTKAVNLVGYSLGAIIALGTAAASSQVKKLAIYEPPLFPTREAAQPVMDRLNDELSQDKIPAALVTAMTGAHLGAPWFNAMPRRFLEFMTKYMMTYGEKEGQGGYYSFRQLAPTLRHDGEVILEMSGRQTAFADISAETLLVGGGKSSKFLKNTLDKLESTIPHAEHREIPGLDHGSAQNSDMRGKPGPIADEFTNFFIAE
jgi:pimeloyl-ACP methyl ester carboxylesterase